MKWNEMKWNEMKWNEMKWNEMKWNEMKWNEMKWKYRLILLKWLALYVYFIIFVAIIIDLLLSTLKKLSVFSYMHFSVYYRVRKRE